MEETKAKVGRPSDYKPEYCQMLIDHMAQGLSFEAFGGIVDCSKETLYTWSEKHPEFLDAKKIATQKCRVFWEKLGVDHIINWSGKDGGKSLNTGVWVFNMKNRFKDEWRDRQEVEHSQDKEQVIRIAFDPKVKPNPK